MYIIMCMEAVYTIFGVFISTHINNNAILFFFLSCNFEAIYFYFFFPILLDAGSLTFRMLTLSDIYCLSYPVSC